MKTESYFRLKHRNVFTTRHGNPKEDRQTIDNRPENLKTSVDCVDSGDGGENRVEIIVTNYQPIKRDMPETVILNSNAVATPLPRHQTHRHHLCYHSHYQIPYHQHILGFQYTLTYNTQSLFSLTKALLINNAQKRI